MSDQKQVRVRFAPSPTGFLHVGGARTALFNWLYARNQGGVFVLRIEDTDRERSTAEAYAAILRSLEWLGLTWDEGPGVEGASGPYLQSERLAFYREQLEQLIAAERVYRCYCTGEDLDQREQAAKNAGGTWDGYDGHCRALSEAQRTAVEQEGRPFCWRLRTPDDGVTFWYDLIVGKREFQNAVIVDRVVVKADGFPTYNFAAAVDDHLMGITHVLRGDDHVSNTPFQLLIYEALGWPLPKFGHMPMILGPDRKRLSKRHGATSVEEFRDQKILPAALVNYLALLGWSIGAGGDEVLTRDQLIKKFSLKKVNSSPAAFDYDKLDFINAQHLKRLEPAERRELTLPILTEHDWQLDPAIQQPATASRTDRVLLHRGVPHRPASVARARGPGRGPPASGTAGRTDRQRVGPHRTTTRRCLRSGDPQLRRRAAGQGGGTDPSLPSGLDGSDAQRRHLRGHGAGGRTAGAGTPAPGRRRLTVSEGGQ